MLKQPFHQIGTIGIIICLFALAGCSEGDFTEWDYKMQKEGYVLHCAEVLNDECLTMRWVLPEDSKTYENYAIEVEEEPSCIPEWCSLPLQDCSLPQLTGGTDSCGQPCSKPSIEWPNCIGTN